MIKNVLALMAALTPACAHGGETTQVSDWLRFEDQTMIGLPPHLVWPVGKQKVEQQLHGEWEPVVSSKDLFLWMLHGDAALVVETTRDADELVVTHHYLILGKSRAKPLPLPERTCPVALATPDGKSLVCLTCEPGTNNGNGQRTCRDFTIHELGLDGVETGKRTVTLPETLKPCHWGDVAGRLPDWFMTGFAKGAASRSELVTSGECPDGGQSFMSHTVHLRLGDAAAEAPAGTPTETRKGFR